MASELSARTSDVRYARTADAHLAYRVIEGEGTPAQDVVLVLSGTMPMDALFEDRLARRLVDGLSGLGRLVMFDRSGIGLSDPPVGSGPVTYARWCDDVDAVVDAARLNRPVIVANMLGCVVALLYGDRHPDDVTALVLVEPTPLSGLDPVMIRGQIASEIDSVALVCPSRADESGFRDWFTRAGQRGAGPRMAERAYPVTNADDVRVIEEAASRVSVPTLLLRRPASPFSPAPDDDRVSVLVPNVSRVDLPGPDMVAFGTDVDELLAAVHRFVTGEDRVSPPERVLAAILYTDLVASTTRAAELGDARWKQLIDRHDEVARSCVGRSGGTVIKTMGDGVLAVLPSVSGALRAADELHAALRVDGLEMRAAVHVSDVDRRGEDISGVGAVIAARILALAGAGETLVSGVAAGAASGESLAFEPRGEYELKGVPGVWSVSAVMHPA